MEGAAEEEICITHKPFTLKIMYYVFLFKLSKFPWRIRYDKKFSKMG